MDFPEVAVAPNAGGGSAGYAVAVVWEDLADGVAGQQQVRDIFESQSTDGGKTWSPRKRITDDPLTNFASKFVPGIAGADGRLDAAWVDFRNDNGNLLSDTYASYSSNGGITWSPNVRVSDHSSNRHYGQFANYSDVRGPVGVASDKYAAYITWDDSRNATDAQPVQDVYFAALQQAEVPTSRGYSAVRIGGAVVGGLIAVGLGLVAAGLMLRRRRRGSPPSEDASGTA